MEAYYQRYTAGACKEVWDELCHQGDAIRHPPLFSEAMSVCREIVDRSSHNLHKLHGSLIELGYRFENPTESLRPPTAQETALVAQIEGTDGLMPLFARVWYEHFGSVDFSQEQGQLYGKDSAALSVAGLGYHPTLTFQSLSKSLEMREELIAENEEDEGTGADMMRFLPTGDFGSNSDPKGFYLPNPGIDGVLYNDGGGDVLFVDELRDAFTWGGFPFWQLLIQRPKKARHLLSALPDFSGLLPALKNGLVQI